MRFRSVDGRNSSSNKSIIIIILVIIAISTLGAKGVIKEYLDKIMSPTKESIKNTLKEVIIEDPQFFINAFREAEIKEMEKMQEKMKLEIQANKVEIEKSDLTPVVGSEDSNVTVVYFFDYNCGYCKKANEIIKNIKAKYPDLKIVYKEFPILGPKSIELAKYALAIYTLDKDKYILFHDALISEPVIKDDTVAKIAANLNINKIDLDEALKNPKIDEEISKINSLALKIGIKGAPALIINDDLVHGSEDFIDKKIGQIKKDLADKKK